MSLDMIGHVDNVFLSLVINRITKGGSYVNGYWVEDNTSSGSFDANIQPLNDRDIRNLGIGLERVGDVRKLYINNAVEDISLKDQWSFLNQQWKTIMLDNRPWRNYCKVVVERIDNAE